MRNEPEMIFRSLEDEGEGQIVTTDDWPDTEIPKPSVVQEDWGDVPTIPEQPNANTVSPDEVTPASEVLPALRRIPKDITPERLPEPPKRVPRERTHQVKAYNYWLDLHREGAMSAKDIDLKTAEYAQVSIAAITQWKSNLEWVKRRVEELSDQNKEKILSLIRGHESIETGSIQIILKYLEQLAKSNYQLDKATVKMMEELITFSRSHLDDFHSRLFEKKISSVTAGLSLTITKE